MGSNLVENIPFISGPYQWGTLSTGKIDFHFGPDIEEMTNGLIVGYGVVGKAFEKILIEAGFMCDVIDPKFPIRTAKNQYDVLHICFPCYHEETFINICVDYINEYNPKYVLIHSTIGIFTAEKILQGWDTSSLKLFHIPIRGVELEGAEGIKKFISFIGPAKGVPDYMDMSLNLYLDKLGMKYEWVSCSRTSAFGKLICTSWYGMIIGFSNMVASITDKYGISFHGAYIRPMETDRIGRRYIKNGRKAEANRFIDRPINSPGIIGGHCVMPNLDLLPEQAEQLVQWIKEMNDYMKEEKEKLVRKEKDL